MFLDKLESGFLLFETDQGWVRVDLTFKQRIYLLWTFRNFRQLSIPLLNPRQRALVNSLFRNHARDVLQSYELLPVIGVVEKFVAPPLPPHLSPTELPVQEKPRPEKMAPPRAEIAPPNVVPFSLPIGAWFKVLTTKILTTKLLTTKTLTSKTLPIELVATKPATANPAISRLATSRLATTFGALTLCVISVAAWHRIQGIPASEAHNQLQGQPIAAIAVLDSANSAKPTEALTENPVAISPRTDSVQPLVVANVTVPNLESPAVALPNSAAVPGAAVKPASIVAVVPTSERTPIPTRKRAIRGRHLGPTPTLPLPILDSVIQASRPPLHFVYPASPDAGVHGKVSLIAAVDSEGAVRTVRVVSGNRALAAAAVRAVRLWRYHPFLKDGQPVATKTNIVISFISDEAISMSYPPSIPAIR